MFEAPLDAWYVWIGLAVLSATTLGIVSTLPTAPPPDASGSARAVDSVAASEHPAVDTHPLSNTDAVRIGADSISLRGGGGTAHAAFGFGPVTPVAKHPDLRAVLNGESPSAVFRTPETFRSATISARNAEPQWQRTDELVVRGVRWEGVDVVLVG